MDFKTKWYSPENKPLEIPTFQDLQNVTGQAFDDFGNYIGKKEIPKQQLVIDKLTQRQYYAPEEYSEDAIRYGKAKIDESFKPKDWYGMTQIKPNYKFMEHISAGYISTLKSLIKPMAELPTKLVYTGAVGLNAISRGNFESAETLYRSSMKNWEQTLDKAGLGADPEIQDMLTVKIGSMVGQTASSLLMAATVSSVGGLPAVSAVFGSQQFADVMEEGLAKGLSHKKAVLVAFQAAVAEGGLEAVGFRLWSGAASMNKSFRNIALGFLWEGAQEGSQQIAESAITNFYGLREQDLYEIMAEVALSALVGGLVGGVGAGLSGQVEQRNIALKKEIGMTEQGNIATSKTKEGKTIKPSKEAEKQFTDQEIAEAKRTGDNKLYNIIKNIANAHGITDEKIIDKLYPVCRKMVSDGATLSNLQDIIGQQVVAYKNQLDNNQIDKEANDKAVEQIKLVTDPNRVDEWRESRKSEIEKAGASKREARIATKNFARAISNLSNRLGFDITQKYDVSFEKRAPMSETLKGIKEREEGDISFNFGANAEEEVLTPFQEGLKTQAELLEAKRSIEQGLRAQKSAPRSTLLSLLRRVGANYSAANRIDKEAYKNAGIRNKKSGIGDELAFFLRDNGFMSFDDPQTYEDKSRLEDEAADLIDRALSGEKIYSIENQALADEVAMAEASREQAEQELRNINIDLTRGQISFLGKVAKIALGETFDFTTLEHEFFHFIDRVVLDAAKEGNVEAQKLVKKRDEIIKKAKADLKKRGIKDMPIDEEILASAYEKWLWQGGKSEDAYEQRLFNAIREFFREVYDTVKGLMGIRITPEADAYFRAMTGEGPNTFYQFAGQTAMTADRLALSKAKEMETSGADNETIRQETGWFKGVDGKWRFEISDSDASVSKAVKTLKKDAVESTEKFNKKIDEFNKKLQKLSDEKKTEEYEKVMDQKLSYIEEQKKPKEKTFKLGDFLQHENLYKAYPELKELRLDIKPMKPNEAGGYSERRKLIELNASLVMTSTEESTKKTLLHEIAHYIQHRENFAAGGSPSQFRSKRMGPSAKRTDYKRAIDSAILYNKLVAAKTKGLKTNLNWPSAAYVEQFLPDLEKLAKEDEAVRKTLDDWKEANEKLKEYDKNTALMKYKRLGGEIEARNVEARSEFTPLETAMISPESTQDIKNADAIVVFDDGTELVYQATEAPTTLFQEGIKSVYNRGTFDTESPNIYYQSDKDLFATHNMSLTGTKQAMKLGGLAMPSMAIRKTDTERVAEFGDVSFVGNENLVKPSRSTEVYDRDAWTPSIYNNIKYRLDPKAKQFIMYVLKKNGKEKQWSMYQWNIQEKLSDISRNELALDLYLLDKGLKDSNRTEAWNSPEYASWYNEHFLDTATPYLYMENDDNTDMVERKLTLNNIMKLLRRQERAAGGYIGDHLFSVQELIKFFPQKFRNLKELRAKKENLQDADRIYAKIEELDNDFAQLVTSLRTSGQEKEYGADTHAVGLAVANHGDKEIQRRWLENAGLPSDDVTLAKVDAFAERMKNEIPVQYFEAKPRRVVEFGQFSGVIMPNTKEYNSLAEQLKTEYGLPVMRIEKGNVAQYKEALNTIQNMYPTTFFQTTQEELFRNDQALKEGAKVLDKAPTNEQVEKELATIRSGRFVESEPKRGFGLAESIGDFVLTVRQRVGTIDKRLKYAFDKLDFNEKMYESKYGKNVVGYIKKYRKLDDTLKRELDYLILNKQDERIREFVRQNDMLEEYNQARTLLDNLYVEGNKAGMDMGFLQEYFPTKVVDPEGLITYLKGTDKWTEIERALAEIDPNNQMSIEDRANAINNILRGYNRADPISKQGFQNERLIFHKTPEMMKFYAPSDEALMRYVSGMSSALAIRNAFNVKNAFNSEESIGGVVQELIKSGQITYKEEAFIRKMLKARLNYARTAPIVALLKNFGYLGTMNNITSAVTQIGDLYANFYKYNFGTAMKALFGKREITKEDLHIDSIWEEFADAGWTGIAVNKLFSAIGLNKFDKFGKETAINGAWIDLKERLKNNDVSLLEDLSAAFGSRAKQVMEDIKNNNITEDVKLLLWTQLADTQPLGKSGVPVGYLNNPHGRIVYQLKTYTINQLSLFYADGIYKINKGLATKNKKLFLQGIGNTAKLALLLTIFNAGADALKNLIMGRKIDISDTLLSNMLWNIGVSKYTFYRGQRDGYARALLENYLLPPQISMGDDAYMDIKKIATGKRKPSDTIAVTYVPFGRMWYWWFGGGRTQEKKKGNKPFEVEL